uniref:Uncharacterized protein n=1 Tax=Populus trichocarpa TaxID=3694 RepID=A0A3N7G3U2_POPTR
MKRSRAAHRVQVQPLATSSLCFLWNMNLLIAYSTTRR